MEMEFSKDTIPSKFKKPIWTETADDLQIVPPPTKKTKKTPPIDKSQSTLLKHFNKK